MAIAVPAVRPEGGPHDPGVLEAGHDLLEELRRQPVPLGEGGQRDRAVLLVLHEVDEGTKTVFGASGEPHPRILAGNA